jgi:hypothetical protein
VKHVLASLLTLTLAGLAGCLFSPAIERYGYTRCDADADCAAGRACFAGRCSPPPWNDPGFGTRQLLVVENPGEDEIPAGAAVPIRVGAGGLLTTDELGADGRFTFYDWAAGGWEDVPAYRDFYEDHLNIWLPVTESVPAGGSAPLAWLDSQSGLTEPQIVELPEQVFALFDDIDVALLDETRWDTFGTGTPNATGGQVNVADNQKLVRLTELVPPFSLTARGRINGATCDQLFVGLVSDPGAGFEPPSVGYYVTGALMADLEVAPTAASVPQQPSDLEQVALDTAEHRFRIDVGSGGVRFAIDGEVVGEPRLSPRFAGDTLYFMIDVDGACSFDLTRLFVTPLPFTHPVVSAEEKVEYEIVE